MRPRFRSAFGRLDLTIRKQVKKPEKKVKKKPEKKVEKKPVRIRKEFPETWLWADEKLRYCVYIFCLSRGITNTTYIPLNILSQ